jgi:kynureninase
MSNSIYQNNLAYAQAMDEKDALRPYRDEFHIPQQANGQPFVYLCGNSLGLQPKSTAANLQQELLDWQNLGVEGHFHAKNPWMPYHEFLTEAMARVVGAKPIEVVVMNTLTVNLHLMMVSFYRPKGKRNKVFIEADAFPSDKYAVESQIKFHGLDPKDCLIELKARAGEVCLRAEDIEAVIEEQGESIALILFGNTNYYTGQYFDMKRITELGHAKGCFVGFDCAHGAGNVPLNLHESGCDFAVWCNYKYLNAGPGSLGGAFVHERHAHDATIPRFEGWWGHNKETRFKMRDAFDPTPGIEAWQLSNPPILSMVAVWSSLQLFDKAGMENLRAKAISLTGYLEFLINSLGDKVVHIVTPKNPNERGSQLSIQVKHAKKDLFHKITANGVIADWREPDVIRVAPVPMYNSYEDVYRFYEILKATIYSIDNGQLTMDN